VNKTFIASLAGALVVLLVVAAFLALDRTTLHWLTDEGPDYSRAEVEALAQSAVQRSAFPNETHWVHCSRATYHSGSHTWLVSCGYWRVKPNNAVANDPRAFADVYAPVIVDDRTGKVTAQ
jgi:hypothetical protein